MRGLDLFQQSPHDGLPLCAGLRKLRLRQDSQNEDLFFFEPMDTANTAANAAGSVATLTSGVSSSFFLDPEGRQTFELQEWLRLVKDFHHEGKPIPPLLINGLVKVSSRRGTLMSRPTKVAAGEASRAACMRHRPATWHGWWRGSNAALCPVYRGLIAAERVYTCGRFPLLT